MLKELIKWLKSRHLNPWPLESSNPLLQLNWRRTRNIYSHRLYPVFLLACHMALAGVLIGVIDYFSKSAIENVLKKWVLLNFNINFFLIGAALIACRGEIIEGIGTLKRKKGACLVLLLALALLLTSLVAPRIHRIYYDEDIYANVGQTMAVTGQNALCNYGTFEYGEYHPHWTSYNKEPSGWPYLMSLAFQLFGVREFYAFLLNNLIFCASLLLVFLIVRELTRSFYASFMGALMFALIPHNLTWSNTMAAEPSAACFAGLTVLTLIVYLRTGRMRHLLLLSAVIPFSVQIRPESLLLIPLVILAFLIFDARQLVNRRLWTFALLISLFLLPHLLHLYAVSGHSWGAEGSKFSLAFFGNNLNVNGWYYLDNRGFPVIFTFLAATGLAGICRLKKWCGFMFVWFLLLWGIFLFFYAGSYKYGADVRFALLSYMPIAVLAGLGAGYLRDRVAAFTPEPGGMVSGIIVFAVFMNFICFLPLVRQEGQEAWGSRYDHRFANEFIETIPKRSIILTQTPSMFLLWGQNAIQTYAGINNPDLIETLMKKYDGHVYFHQNYWCNTQNLRNIRLCRTIREKYHLTEIVSAREQTHFYGLFKMAFRE